MSDQVTPLEQLAVMRERGLITDQEYQAKRADILARLAPTPVVAARPSAASPTRAPAPARPQASRRDQILGTVILIGIIWTVGTFFFGKSGSGSSPTRTTTPQQPAWAVPAGFTSYSGDVAYRWIDPSSGDCIAEKCFAMEVVTRSGCPNSLYVELSLVDSAGTAVGYTNDVAGATSAGQKARLAFDVFEQSAREARLTTINCY